MVHLKSEQEIERLRASADLVGRTLGEVARHVRPGVTTMSLDRIAETFIRDHRAVPAFKGYRVGRLQFPATLCTSINDVVVHGIPAERELEEGDLVSVDCGVILDGYYGDSAYTFGIGEISAEDARLCSATYESLQRGISASTAGNRLGDIGWAVQEHCESAGFGVVRQRRCLQLGDPLTIAFGTARMQAGDAFLGTSDHAANVLVRLANDRVRLLLALFDFRERVPLGVQDERHCGVDRQIIVGLGIHKMILGAPGLAGHTY